MVQEEVRRAGDPGSNSGPGDSVSLKVNTVGYTDVSSESQICVNLYLYLPYIIFVLHTVV